MKIKRLYSWGWLNLVFQIYTVFEQFDLVDSGP